MQEIAHTQPKGWDTKMTTHIHKLGEDLAPNQA